MRRRAARAVGPIDVNAALRLLASEAVFRTEPARSELAKLEAEFRDEFQPVTPEESLLVRTAAASHWRSRCSIGLETAILNEHIAHNDQNLPPKILTAMAVHACLPRMLKIQTCHERFQNQYLRAIKRLMQIARARRAAAGTAIR